MSPLVCALSVFATMFTYVVSAPAGEPKNPCIIFQTGGTHRGTEPPDNYTAKYEFYDQEVLDHLAEVHVQHLCKQPVVYELLKICYSGPQRWCMEWFQDAGDAALAPLAPLDPVCLGELRYTDTQYCRDTLQAS